MVRGFATPIRSLAVRCCRPWVQVWQCCPKVLKASDTGRRTARSLSASKAAVRPMWTVLFLNGAPRTFLSYPHGSVTRTTRQKSRSCSRFPTARRRKRSASGANKVEHALPAKHGPVCDGRCRTKKEADQGIDGRLGSRDRHGNPCPGQFPCQIVFRRFH